MLGGGCTALLNLPSACQRGPASARHPQRGGSPAPAAAKQRAARPAPTCTHEVAIPEGYDPEAAGLDPEVHGACHTLPYPTLPCHPGEQRGKLEL